MSELLKSIIRQFNNVLYYDSSYFRILVLDPLLMNDHSFLALYKETIEFYADLSEIETFKTLGIMEKNSIVFKCMIFAARRKSIADGKSQLDFFKTIFCDGIICIDKLFNELIIPWLEDFKIITSDDKYSALLDYYTYKIPIMNVPMYGEFAISIYKKMNDLETDQHDKNVYKIWNWCTIF